MRLYLSSFRLGQRTDRLLDLITGHGRVAVVADAMDGAPPDVRSAAVQLEVEALSELGLRPVEVDLRTHVDPDRLVDELTAYDALWVRGGNVFTLRHALARSGGDEAVRALLGADTLAYAGYSAGPCVLAQSLRGLEDCDDPADVGVAFPGAVARYDGLGVLDHAVVPHVDSPDHPESAMLDEVAAAYRRDGVAHVTLRDGQALVIDGETREVV